MYIPLLLLEHLCVVVPLVLCSLYVNCCRVEVRPLQPASIFSPPSIVCCFLFKAASVITCAFDGDFGVEKGEAK